MGPPNILIVDDEMDMRFFLATLVETNGYRFVLAKDGAEGLAAVRKHRPAMIILDIMMPKEGGIHMYGELKTDSELCDIPVVILSAISRHTFHHYLKMLSVRVSDIIPEPDAYLEKPPEAEEILSVIHALIGTSNHALATHRHEGEQKNDG